MEVKEEEEEKEEECYCMHLNFLEMQILFFCIIVPALLTTDGGDGDYAPFKSKQEMLYTFW